MQHYRTLSNSLILKKASRYRCNSIIFLSSYKNLKKENNLNNQKFKSEINYKNLILLQNQNGKFGQEAAYSKVIEKDSKDNNLVEKLSFKKLFALKRNFIFLKNLFFVAFFPRGYPRTVTSEYWDYSKWQFLNSISGTIIGTLSMQALLQSMGMGAGSAIGLAASTNWIIKDGFGLLGGVIFASVVNNKFDSKPKQYRFLANFLIQFSSFIELLTPLFPKFFILLASISNIGKNIGWLATSATRVSMNRGVTREDNLGDVTAKSGAQSTAAGLIGTGFGVVLSYFVGVEPLTLMAVFIPSTILNMYFAYKTNTSVVVKTFNLERGEICLREFCEKIVSSHFEKYNNVKKLEKNKLDFSIINSKKVEQNFLKFKNLLKDPSEVGKDEDLFFLKRNYNIKGSKLRLKIELQLEPKLRYENYFIFNNDFDKFKTGYNLEKGSWLEFGIHPFE
ncbi:hypothetical protein HDU92_002300 [Lobulomyces angularis]|nr:hypothetical protein HDU92_002300 [Lobulomyces angularis]